MKTIYTCFPEGKFKALSMSYDDGNIADRRLVDLFNRFSIRGTFHINSGLLGREDLVGAKEIPELYKGHEVAAHTFTHPTIQRCPKEQVALQVLEDRKMLEELVGYSVRGLSYPNGSWSKDIAAMLPSIGIEYGRLVDTTGNFHIQDDFLTWKTTCHHNQSLLVKAKEFLGLSKKQYLYWFSVWGHSYEFDTDGTWDMIETFCRMTGGRDDIWFTTVIGMVDYLKAAHGVRVSVAGSFAENPSGISIWLSVDGTIVEIPAGSTVGLLS